MSPSEKIIHFHINMNMSPYDLSPNAYYSYQSPFWYEILRWWQVWILHTKPPYGDICHHMEAWYEKFSYLSPKKPFRWWRSERFYHRAKISPFFYYLISPYLHTFLLTLRFNVEKSFLQVLVFDIFGGLTNWLKDQWDS